MPIFRNSKQWAYGLFAGVIGGFFGAINTGITNCVVAPNTFNLGNGLLITLQAMLTSAALMALTHLAAYLMKSPLPTLADDTTTITKTESVTITAPTEPPKT